MADSLLSEVDADVRAERMAQLWKQYRTTLFLVVAAIILGTTAYTLWQKHELRRGGKLMQDFSTGQSLYNAGKYDEATEIFAALASKTTGQTQTLAELWESRAQVAGDEKDAAIATLKKASVRGNGIWSDLACLRLASLDAASATCLAKKNDSPLQSERREWQAASQWAAGDKDGAVAILEQLETSPDTSDATRTRVREWLATMREQKSAQ